jgi:hypothetical protein
VQNGTWQVPGFWRKQIGRIFMFKDALCALASKRLAAALVVCTLAVALVPSSALAQKSDLPDDFEQILPRGRIAAITNPKYVSAAEAEISDSSWVLGVVIDGQARAFSLTLLNHHEVVNDTIGDTSYAAVW